VVVYICNPSAQEAKAEGLGIGCQPGLNGETLLKQTNKQAGDYALTNSTASLFTTILVLAYIKILARHRCFYSQPLHPSHNIFMLFVLKAITH
jgi:hypothetical protein